MKSYSTNLTDSQWNLVDNLLNDKRPRKYEIRNMFDGIFYLPKTGCQWRMLPLSFPPWQTVYYYFTVWKHKGTIERIHEHLRDKVRIKAGKDKSPSLGLIDSQSVKTTRSGGICRGIDGGKKIKGRKRHIIVDTLELLIAVVVHAANEHDSKSAPKVIALLKEHFSRLLKIIADGGYRGELIENTKTNFGLILEVILRKDDSPKFQVIPKRWVVERTFGFINTNLRKNLCLN